MLTKSGSPERFNLFLEPHVKLFFLLCQSFGRFLLKFEQPLNKNNLYV